MTELHTMCSSILHDIDVSEIGLSVWLGIFQYEIISDAVIIIVIFMQITVVS